MRHASFALRIALPVLLVMCAWLAYRYQGRAVRRAWLAWTALARRRALAAGLVGVLALALRLAVLPVLPPPHFTLPDEFSHRLFAETMASGRFTNPTPPAWENIESLFILYEPVYQSKYPMGQALTLVAGKLLLGAEWYGVLLAFALMAAAVCWMLQGWVSPPWALLGAVIMVLRIGVFSDWINTYMGGALAALAGALSFGAIPRLARRPSWKLSALMGLGIGLLMHVRPFESVLFCAVCFLSAWVLLGLKTPPVALVRTFAPAVLAVAGSLAVVALHNWNITGSPLVLPYQLHKQTQGTPQGMYWQAVVPRPKIRLKRIEAMYDWQVERHAAGATPAGYLAEMKNKWVRIYDFFFGYYFVLPLACAVPMFRKRKVAILLAAFAAAFLWSSMYGFFWDYYIGALMGISLALTMTGLARLARWRWGALPAGGLVAAAVALSAVQTLPFRLVQTIRHPESLEENRFRRDLRGEVEAQLRPLGDRHIVFVRSRRGGRTPAAWYYNGPDPRTAAIVWAQEIDPARDARFLESYPGRRVWVLDADARVPRLAAYREDAAGAAPSHARMDLHSRLSP